MALADFRQRFEQYFFVISVQCLREIYWLYGLCPLIKGCCYHFISITFSAFLEILKERVLA